MWRIAPLIASACAIAMLCGISPIFTGLFPTSRKVIHVLRTRSPRAHTLYCYRMLRVRLACVKHAASVRSEPGSNSRLKPDVSTVSICIATIGTNCYIARLSQYSLVPVHPKQERNQTGSGMYHPIVKEQVIPGQLEGLQTNRHPIKSSLYCQALIPVENSATCGFLVTPVAQAFLPVPTHQDTTHH